MKTSIPCLLLFAVLVFSNCKKKEKEERTPTAAFVTEKPEYYCGETLKLVNTSSNGSTYKWTLPNQTTVESIDLEYPTSIFDSPKQYLFKLDVFSESGAKTAHFETFIQVKPTQGQVVLYNDFAYDTVMVSLDGEPLRQIIFPHITRTSAPMPAPACNAAGYPAYTLKMGAHVLKGEVKVYNWHSNISGIMRWEKVFEVKPNTCNAIPVYKSK